MKIAYHGYYGARNSGDDAFAEVAVWGAEKFWNCREHLFFAPELPLTGNNIKSLFAHKSYTNFTRAIYQIYNSDIFVSAGGSTFHSQLKKTDLRLYAKLKKQSGLKGKIGAIGISLGPYRNRKAEESTIDYLKRLDFLSLRDNFSYELASSYNLPYKPVNSFDLAALLPEVYPIKIVKRKNLKQKIVGISVCNYESYTGGDITKEEQRNAFLYYILDNLQKDFNIRFRFFIFNGHLHTGDSKLTQLFVNNLSTVKNTNYELISYSGSVKDIFESISECDIMLATRLHAAIFACFAGIPFLLVEYHRKCKDFLDDIGQEKKYRLYDGDRDIADVIHNIQDILYEDNYITPHFIHLAKEKALRNFLETIPSSSNLSHDISCNSSI